jgi:hypothetical protein
MKKILILLSFFIPFNGMSQTNYAKDWNSSKLINRSGYYTIIYDRITLFLENPHNLSVDTSYLTIEGFYDTTQYVMCTGKTIVLQINIEEEIELSKHLNRIFLKIKDDHYISFTKKQIDRLFGKI